MKAFIFAYSTNYNLGAAIIYAETKEKAIELAKTSNQIWDTDNVHEIDLSNKQQVLIINETEFWEDKFCR